MSEAIFMRLCMYVMSLQPISTACSKNFTPPLVSVSVSITLLSLLGNGLVNMFPRQRIHTTLTEWLDACVCGSLSVRTFPRQRIVGGVIFCGVHIVPTKSGRLVLPRTSCYVISCFYEFKIVVCYSSLVSCA
jgi:hypothetical protein